MQNVMSKKEILSEIRNLNVIERLNIITDIWDEIKESRELESLSEDQNRILVHRLANYKANPEFASDWSDLKQEIYNKYAEKS